MPGSARCGVDRQQEPAAEAETPDVAGDTGARAERRAVRPARWVCVVCGNQLTLSDRYCSMCGHAVGGP